MPVVPVVIEGDGDFSLLESASCVSAVPSSTSSPSTGEHDGEVPRSGGLQQQYLKV